MNQIIIYTPFPADTGPSMAFANEQVFIDSMMLSYSKKEGAKGHIKWNTLMSGHAVVTMNGKTELIGYVDKSVIHTKPEHL